MNAMLSGGLAADVALESPNAIESYCRCAPSKHHPLSFWFVS